jgi:RNA polymerase sigma-70 factor (ECF subfamily)
MVSAALESLVSPIAAEEKPTYPVEPLVERCKSGEQAAYRELFQKYHSWVQGTVYHLVPGPSDLDDVVQNVFLEVFRSIHRFEGRSRFSTWLTRLAINVAMGYRRKWKFWQRTEETAGTDEGLTSAAVEALRPPSPDDAVGARRTRAAVHRLVAQLSPKKKVVFVLSEIQGLQAPEIATLLGIPSATVRTRLFHARKDFEMLARSDPTLGPRVNRQE